MALVVKKWYAEASPNDNGEYINIFARKSGLMAWALSLMRLDPTVYFGMYLDRVEFRVSKLSGYVKATAPVSAIATCYYGYAKPWKQALFVLLVFTFIAFSVAQQSLIGGIATLLVGMMLAIGYFLLKRELSFGVTLHSGHSFAMAMRRSIIEGAEIDENSFERVSAIITSIIRRYHEGGGHGAA